MALGPLDIAQHCQRAAAAPSDQGPPGLKPHCCEHWSSADSHACAFCPQDWFQQLSSQF
jgi:hypothetical protein